MRNEIVSEKIRGSFDDEYVAGDFPLIAAMCAKNDYSGCDMLHLVTGEGVVSVAVVDPGEEAAKLCAFESRGDSRGKGFGTELLLYILERYGHVVANVLREALGFYEKCGFNLVSDNGGPVVSVEGTR
jgi:GNAT superfamily N-acetyltransferase